MSDVYTKKHLHEQTVVWALVMLGYQCWIFGCMDIKDECMKARTLTQTAACRPAGRTRGCHPGTLSLIKVTAAHLKPGHPHISSTGVLSLKRASDRHDHQAVAGITAPTTAAKDAPLIAWKSTPNTLLKDLYAPEPKDSVLNVSLLVLFRDSFAIKIT